MEAFQRLAIVAAALAIAGSARADMLYWMVDSTADDAVYKVDYSYAALFVSDGNGGGTQLDNYYKAENGKVDPTLSDLDKYGSNGSTYSFYVELYNASNAAVRRSETVSYNDLVTSGYIWPGGTTLPMVVGRPGFNGASGRAVPEPTSGLLALIGGALLALRRRRGV